MNKQEKIQHIQAVLTPLIPYWNKAELILGNIFRYDFDDTILDECIDLLARAAKNTRDVHAQKQFIDAKKSLQMYQQQEISERKREAQDIENSITYL